MTNNDTKLKIEKIAKKLDKFTLDEIIMISEFDENEVKNILDELIKEYVILQKEETYFYSKTKNKKIMDHKNLSFDEIDIKTLDGYDEYIKLSPNYKKIVDKRINIIKLINGLSGEDFKTVIDLYNAQHPNDTIGYSTATMLRLQFENYELRGLFPKIRGQKDRKTPTIIYDTFKKYYLNNNKFSTEVALKLAQTELQNAHKIDFPLVYNAKVLIAQLIKELGKPTIEHLRNTAEFIVPEDNKIVHYEPLDISFSEAAEFYFKKLSQENKKEKLLNYKTSYQNHIIEFFKFYKLKEITPELLKKFKQEKYNTGYTVSSVKNYLNIVRAIILCTYPDKNNVTKQLEFLTTIDMNILEKEQIEKMLYIAKEKYNWGYPIIRLALSTGANIPEILALKWENIFFTEKQIYISKFLYKSDIINHRNNSSFRYLKIDDECVKALVDIYSKTIPDKSKFVFKIDGIDNMQKYFEDNVLAPITKKLDLDNFATSDFVHNFVNMLLTQNVPISYIRRTCGYSSIKTFLDVYNARLEEGEKDYYNPFNMK